MTTLAEARETIRNKARAILLEQMETDTWGCLADLQVSIGRSLDEFLVRRFPAFVLDYCNVRRMAVKPGVDMIEVDLDIISTDRPTGSGWSTALLFKDCSSSPQP